MKGATLTDTASERIQDTISGPVSKAFAKTEYYSDTQSTFVELSDIESRSISLSSENKRYLSYSFMPPSKTLNLAINNFEQLYSTGSGNPKASILKKNLLIRAWSGYELTGAGVGQSQSDNLTSNVQLYHTQKIGSRIYLDVSSATFAPDTAAEIGAVYGTTTYGDTAYAYPGYYKKTFDITSATEGPRIYRFNVTTNSNKLEFKYRTSHLPDFSGAVWSSYVALSTGSNQITINGIQDQENMQYYIRFTQDVWDTSVYFATASISYYDNIVKFKQGTFIIDDPKYSNVKVNITGRDYLRKALETEINMPDMVSSPVNVATAITYALDRCNVPYNTATWDATSTTVQIASGTIAESLNDISGWKVIDYLMDAINAGDDDWRFRFNEDGQAELTILKTNQEADWVAHYYYNIENISKGFDSEKQLQRVTALNKSIVVNEETQLVNSTGTATSDSLHFTYNDALYVRYEDTNSVIQSESARTNTSITFTVNSGAAYDIKVYGCEPKNAIVDEVWAEKGNSDNIINNDGATYKNVNPFFNQNMCNKYVDYMITLNADPKKRIELDMVANPLLELQDNLLVFDLYTYTDDIYNLDTINETWNDPALKHKLILKDRGISLGAVIYDRNQLVEGINDLTWDNNFVYDQDLSIGGSDTRDYDRTKPVRMQ